MRYTTRSFVHRSVFVLMHLCSNNTNNNGQKKKRSGSDSANDKQVEGGWVIDALKSATGI